MDDAVVAEIRDGLIDLDEPAVNRGVEKGLSIDLSAVQIINYALVPAMDEIGRKFENKEYFITELILAGDIMKKQLSSLVPIMALESDVITRPKVLIGTVEGDLHDIGKSLVSVFLTGSGYDVIDLGVNVAPATFVGKVQEHDADVVALSCLLTTTMPKMKQTVATLKQSFGNALKIIVGGRPITQNYADSIGADGYGQDAAHAASNLKSLLGGLS